jgi:hypothetical protein
MVSPSPPGKACSLRPPAGPSLLIALCLQVKIQPPELKGMMDKKLSGEHAGWAPRTCWVPPPAWAPAASCCGARSGCGQFAAGGMLAGWSAAAG